MPKSPNRKKKSLSTKNHGFASGYKDALCSVAIPGLEQELEAIFRVHFDALRHSLRKLGIPYAMRAKVTNDFTDRVPVRKEAISRSFANACENVASTSSSTPRGLSHKYESVKDSFVALFDRSMEIAKTAAIAEATSWAEQQTLIEFKAVS
jgi:hypothetical protein